MKNEKVCISKSVGIFALVAVVLIVFIALASAITQTQTSTSTKAARPKAKGICKGGVYQMNGGACYEMYAIWDGNSCKPKPVGAGKCGDQVKKADCKGGKYALVDSGNQYADGTSIKICQELDAIKCENTSTSVGGAGNNGHAAGNQGDCCPKEVSLGKCGISR
jgi:hypothetical protein